MTQNSNWKSSPHALEFLPDEIERLEAGTMTICADCLWPRLHQEPCDHGEKCKFNQDRG